MTLEVKKYVRLPEAVEAVQLTPENFSEVAEWCKGQPAPNHGLSIRTLEGGYMRANLGDYIIKLDKRGTIILVNSAVQFESIYREVIA